MVHESLNFRLGGTQLSSKRPYSASEAFQEFEIQILSWPQPLMPWMGLMVCDSNLDATVRAQLKFTALKHLLLVLEPNMAL